MRGARARAKAKTKTKTGGREEGRASAASHCPALDVGGDVLRGGARRASCVLVRVPSSLPPPPPARSNAAARYILQSVGVTHRLERACNSPASERKFQESESDLARLCIRYLIQYRIALSWASGWVGQVHGGLV
ncbi:hypothetical protein SCP_1501510 [Sparassis crispa]|uniref:Uncharacterized protein n=1 Tax=Sparassis crispa TaxID=139825 RepID=A0A401H3X8_9APHY|nr:hypothetical protein SCP_1501510 [Sparassis crispa]GBE89145.1 hypothetical protein SCP_1501510 [Sparassis crispa]